MFGLLPEKNHLLIKLNPNKLIPLKFRKVSKSLEKLTYRLKSQFEYNSTKSIFAVSY